MTALFLATTIALRGATLIDGTGAPAVPDALLVIRDGRIVSAGPATPESLAAVPTGVSVRDVSRRWIVPGLIDAHVHADSEDDLKEMLRWGVTSVRLMAEDTAAAQKLAERSRYPGARWPDVFPAAPIFTAKGGWWDEGEPPDRGLNRFPDTPAEARASVAAAKALGSAEIKLMLDDMAWCRAPRPTLPRMKAEVAKALVVEARRLGLRATVHAPQVSDAREAIADGATALAHGVLDRLDPKTIAEMKRRPVFYIPTMDIFEFLADPRAFLDQVLADPAALSIGREKAARYRSRAYADQYKERYPNFENVRRHLPLLYENLRRLHEAGVPVALGTDMWAFPGLGVSIELDLYVRAGFSPLEAIRAATQTAARSLGVEKDRGTLEPGRKADFLLLEEDPLRDVKNVRRIVEVFKDGEPRQGAAR
ncbi:MAG TPA: amidohydrolase family protein [Thermoanaerobaculia bacterium]|nr:amidohydrolase family protein [Thermoanaerobaculia bacterium]